MIEKKRGWHVRKPLDLDLIKKGAKKLVGTHDYSTFRSQVATQKVQLKQLNQLRLNHQKINRNRI